MVLYPQGCSTEHPCFLYALIKQITTVLVCFLTHSQKVYFFGVVFLCAILPYFMAFASTFLKIFIQCAQKTLYSHKVYFFGVVFNYYSFSLHSKYCSIFICQYKHIIYSKNIKPAPKANILLALALITLHIILFCHIIEL